MSYHMVLYHTSNMPPHARALSALSVDSAGVPD